MPSLTGGGWARRIPVVKAYSRARRCQARVAAVPAAQAWRHARDSVNPVLCFSLGARGVVWRAACSTSWPLHAACQAGRACAGPLWGRRRAGGREPGQQDGAVGVGEPINASYVLRAKDEEGADGRLPQWRPCLKLRPARALRASGCVRLARPHAQGRTRSARRALDKRSFA